MATTKDITRFSAQQLDALRQSYGKFTTLPTESVADFRRLFSKCTDGQIIQLVKASIKFVSALARNEATRRDIPADRLRFQIGDCVQVRDFRDGAIADSGTVTRGFDDEDGTYEVNSLYRVAARCVELVS